MHTGVKAELKAVARISGDMLYSKKKKKQGQRQNLNKVLNSSLGQM